MDNWICDECDPGEKTCCKMTSQNKPKHCPLDGRLVKWRLENELKVQTS